MSIGLLILLIVVGFLLISIEISVVPGITFAGIAGIVLLVITIILAYYNFGYSMGNMVLIGSSVISFALFFIFWGGGGSGFAVNCKMVSAAVVSFALNLI